MFSDGATGLYQLSNGAHLWPPRFVLLVAMTHLPDLLPPCLQLGVDHHRPVVQVVDGAVLGHLALDSPPDGQPVHRVRVVLDR